MAEHVTHNGLSIPLAGPLPQKGDEAPDFTFVKTDLSEGSLYDSTDQVRILLCFPSLDTSTCAIETRRFNEELSERKDVLALVVTMDLPFAMRRFCEGEGIENVEAVSDFRYRDFSEEYQAEMVDGKMKGLFARAVWVLDKNNVIQYFELVKNVSDEPDYDRVLEEVDKAEQA